MTIYVDRLRRYPGKMHEWAHLVSDESMEELHAFAKRIGMKAQWFQGDHYDVQTTMHWKAQQAGAILVDTRGMVEVIKRMRERGLREYQR